MARGRTTKIIDLGTLRLDQEIIARVVGHPHRLVRVVQTLVDRRRQLAHTVSVMQRGRVIEHGTVTDIFDNPQQPYTRSLLESIPSGANGIARAPQSQPRRIFREEKIA